MNGLIPTTGICKLGHCWRNGLANPGNKAAFTAARRFSITFNSAEIAALNGSALFVHGISAVSVWPNSLLIGR